MFRCGFSSWAFGISLASWVSLSGLAHAGALSLDEVLLQGVENSYALKIAEKETEISRSDVRIARSDYFPVLRSQINLEYLRNLSDSAQPVVAVGNTIIPSGTRYQNSIGVALNYTLVDYGIRRRKVSAAKEDVSLKVAISEQTIRNLKLRLIELYTQALLDYKVILANQAILSLAQQGYQMKKRLYAAGTHSQVDVASAAIQVAQTMDEMESARQQLIQDLQNISYYTQVSYDAMTVELLDFIDVSETIGQTDFLQSPEARNYDAQIAKKQKEIEILKRQALPQVSIYSNYNLYGFDPEHLSKSIQNLSQRTASLGLSVGVPLFDGLKNHEMIRKASLEKEKLVLEKTKAMLDLQHQAAILQGQVDANTVLLKTKANILNNTQDKLSMENRLSEQQVIDKTQALQDHIARIQKQLETDKTRIQGISALKKLRILKAGT